MADFCNKCAMDMWGEEIPADIDIPKIYRMLDNLHFETFICEGCGMIALGKHDDKCLALFDDDKSNWKEINLDEYLIPKNKRVKLHDRTNSKAKNI